MQAGKFKKFTVAAFACALACTAAAAPALAAFADTENVTYSGLGCSVNVPCGGVDGEKPAGSVFESGFITDRIKNAVPITVRQSTVFETSSCSIADVVNAYKSGLKMKNGEAVFESDAAVLHSTIDYSSYPYQYYYFRYSEFIYCTLTLPEYTTRIEDYIDGLDEDYLAALENYFMGGETAEALFTEYGTHVVMKGVYGRRWISLCTAVSATTDLSEYASTLKQKAEKALNGEAFSALDKAGISVPVTEVNISALCSPHAQTWDEFNKSGYLLTNATTDGLVPLWKLLPERWSAERYAEKLKNDYNTYAKNYELDVDALIKSRPVAEKGEEQPPEEQDKTDKPDIARKTNGVAIALIGAGVGLMAVGAVVLIVFAILGRRNKNGGAASSAPENKDKEEGNGGEEV